MNVLWWPFHKNHYKCKKCKETKLLKPEHTFQNGIKKMDFLKSESEETKTNLLNRATFLMKFEYFVQLPKLQLI